MFISLYNNSKQFNHSLCIIFNVVSLLIYLAHKYTVLNEKERKNLQNFKLRLRQSQGHILFLLYSIVYSVVN